MIYHPTQSNDCLWYLILRGKKNSNPPEYKVPRYFSKGRNKNPIGPAKQQKIFIAMPFYYLNLIVGEIDIENYQKLISKFIELIQTLFRSR